MTMDDARDDAARGARRRLSDQLALEVWQARRRERLAAEPEAVRAEILSEARDRQLREGRIVWSARDTALCRMRVISRARLKRYGAIPRSAAEWKRQVAEIREALGIAP